MGRRPADQSGIQDDTQTNRSAARSERPSCLVIISQGRITAFSLPPKGDIEIGRSSAAHLHIEDAAISRHHALLRVDAERLTLEDLGSANGTRVRGVRIEPRVPIPLAEGHVVEIGGAMLIPKRFLPGTATDPKPGSGLVWEGGLARRMGDALQRIAAGSINVIILGETGVGKEVVAERLHVLSPRASKPLVRLNCASFSETLLESELFGHEKGAFTGAVRTKPGLLETADGGTVFLDEIGDLPGSLQAKLLRVLEEQQVRRVGALTPRPIDVRFIAATHRDLQAAIGREQFRSDLYFRLAGFTFEIPPLRERGDEIQPLARHFIDEACAAANRPVLQISDEALAMLQAHTWPGNIRELKNVIQRASLLCAGQRIQPEDLPLDRMSAPATSSQRTMKEIPVISMPVALRDEVEAREREVVIAALERCGGNQTQAAKQLGISRSTLIARIAQFGIDRPRKPRKG